MEEKVDVLMATYQTDLNYLKKQIDSILNQTYQNINLIISDDHSKVEALEKMLHEYQEKDNRITIYLQEENKGYMKNFEFLLSQSEAKYICFCDHDDIWYPEKIEKSVEKLIADNVDLVYVNAKQIDEKDNVIRESYFKYKNMPLITGQSKLAISRCIGLACSQLFTKEVKDKMIPYKDSVMAQDWLAAFIANQGKGLAYIEEPLYNYRLHQTNVFGGRNLAQNLARWKQENGTSYESYLKYRNEKVIDKAYLDGALMCLDYEAQPENKKWITELISYYKGLKNSRYINFHWIQFIKFLTGKNLMKKMIKEFIIFHIPMLGYYIFKR